MFMPPGKGPKSVWERSRMTGFVAGPDNKLVNEAVMSKMGEGAGAAPEGEGGGPPNLRDAAATMDSCGTCTHYAGMKCTKFEADVNPNEICDEFAKVGAVEPEESDEMTMRATEDSEVDEDDD